MKLLIAGLILCVAALAAGAPSPGASVENVTKATVYQDGGKWVLKTGVVDKEKGVAFGSFADQMDVNGWGVLHVETNEKFGDDAQLYAAGFLEGALTSQRIWEHYENLTPLFLGNATVEARLRQWFAANEAWVGRQVRTANGTSPLWSYVGAVAAQFDGLVAGQQAHSAHRLDRFAFQYLNGIGDLIDLVSALFPERQLQWEAMSLGELKRAVATTGHCSGLIKVTPAYDDLFMAHSSWFTFSAMNRIYKHYNFNLNNPSAAAKQVSFSSYPGFLSSLDDFYLMDSGLGMTQTTNNIFNAELYEHVVPESILAWQRVRAACQLAHDGREWAQLVGQHNSGTYNNQYMVVDFSKFRQGEGLDDGALWVVEQIPTLVESQDATEILRTGYWPSYNVPFFETVYQKSGYPSVVAKHGADFSYQLAPRAKIFRRDANNVGSFDDLKHIMRYNEFQTDPLSEHNPADAICSRIDLETQKPSPDGCYDTKVTNFSRAKLLQSEALNGPTAQDQPPFSWAEFPDVKHEGMPTVFAFDFVPMGPEFEAV